MTLKEIDYIEMDKNFLVHSKDGKIERFTKNGEMAAVEWFRQGNSEFNGKYVKSITYIK